MECSEQLLVVYFFKKKYKHTYALCLFVFFLPLQISNNIVPVEYKAFQNSVDNHEDIFTALWQDLWGKCFFCIILFWIMWNCFRWYVDMHMENICFWLHASYWSKPHEVRIAVAFCYIYAASMCWPRYNRWIITAIRIGKMYQELLALETKQNLLIQRYTTEYQLLGKLWISIRDVANYCCRQD